MGFDLSFFYNKYNFKFDGNLAYGIFENRIISIKGQGSYIKVTISFNKALDKNNVQQLSLKIKELKSKYKILQQGVVSNVFLNVFLYQANDLLDHFENALHDIVELINLTSDVGIETCPLCGLALTTDAPFIRIGDSVMQAHENCVIQLEELNKKVNNEIENKKNNLLIPLISGLCSMILIVVFFTLLSLASLYPYFVGLSGWICYFIIRFAYKKFKVPFTKKNAIILTIYSVLSLLLCIFIGAIGYFYKNLIDFTIIDILKNYFAIFKENPDLLHSVIYSFVWGILLVGIPLVFMFIQLKQSQKKIKRL